MDDRRIREIHADPTYLDLALGQDGRFEQPIPRGHTAVLYVYRGAVVVGGAAPARGAPRIEAPRLVILSDGEIVRVHAAGEPARVLLLSAQPLGEPYARYGPFVMNTREEILQALHELREGTFVKAPRAAPSP